ncbi:MAG: nucleotide exchange factor GrpE [Bacteroidales bacterium]|nr:nucleotide exchange factor GrpE [Bacteroidales bacterium]
MKQKKSTGKSEDKTVFETATDNIAETNAPPAAEQEQTAAIPKLYTEEEYQLKVNELNDKYLRLYSEFDNFRKRTLKEKIDLSRTASENIIVDLLPVLDDFDRAIASMASTDNIEAIKEGEQLIHAKMKAIFASKGLQEIKSIGENFDTDFHEAITSIPAPTEDLKNKVVDEVQKGYTLHDKVIRFSKVITGS